VKASTFISFVPWKKLTIHNDFVLKKGASIHLLTDKDASTPLLLSKQAKLKMSLVFVLKVIE